MRRFAAWALLILAAFLVLTGAIDLAVGPEMEAQETGDAGSRWLGLIPIAIGVVLVALGHRLGREAAKG